MVEGVGSDIDMVQGDMGVSDGVWTSRQGSRVKVQWSQSALNFEDLSRRLRLTEKGLALSGKSETPLHHL